MAFAPWTVDQIYNFMLWLTKKNQSGAISSGRFFFTWNSESSSYFKDLLGRFQSRSNGKTGANTGLLQNATIETELAPFTKTVTIVTAAGQATKPTDFIYKLGMRSNGFPVFKAQKNEIATIQKSLIDPPSITDNTYYYTDYLTYYQIFPTATASIDLDYISHPVDVVWGFTIDGSNRQVYNSVTSVQPLWLQTEIIEITKRTLKLLGVAFKDVDFSNYGRYTIETGD